VEEQTLKLPLIAAFALTLAAAPAAAHHSFAMFDQAKEVELEGVIREFQWTNPHTWVQVVVTDKSGKAVEWSIEGSSPNGLARQGWKRNSLKAGDRVSVTINPLKNGEPGGSLVRVKLPDGTVLGRQAGRTPG